MSVPSIDHFLHSFDAALAEEIKALQATSSTSSPFPNSPQGHAPDDCPTSHNLALLPEEETPEPIDEALPLVSSVHLLRRLQERLQLIRRNPTPWSTQLALKALSPSAQPETVTTPKNIPRENSLDESQSEAYHRALTDDVLFLWGPPGTGKTRVIGEILHTTLSRGLRVLLCSTTNSAVDHALEEVLGHVEENYTDRILRVGTPNPDASLRIHTVTLSQRLDEHGASLREEFTQLEETLPLLEAEATDLRDLANHAHEKEKQQRHRLALMRDRYRVDRSLTSVEDQIRVITTRQQQAQNQLKAIPSWRERVFPRRRKKFQEEIDANNQTIESLQARAADLLQTLSTIEDQLTKVQTREHELATELDGERRSRQEIRAALELANALLTHKHARLEEIRARRHGLERGLVERAQVIATTLTRASCFRLLESERFDLVIVDEASVASVPALFATLCLAKHHVILVGDFLQLPPIAQHASSDSSRWLTQSIYEVAQIRDQHDSRVAALTTQYRMHPDIGELAGTLYRQRGLPFRSAPSLSDDRHPVVSLPPFPHSALAVVDTTQARPQIHRDERGSPLNFYHALVVIRLVTQTLLNIHTASIPFTVAVITPYRAQSTGIQKVLRHQGLDKQVHVGTVHQCQGQQFDLVIFDTTIVNNLRQSFLCQPDESGGGTTLLNVAMTRAKSKLILIGHARALSALPPETFLRTCFDYTSLRGVTINSTHFVPRLSQPMPDRCLNDDHLIQACLQPLNAGQRPFLTTV